jgi:aminomethyltransferase
MGLSKQLVGLRTEGKALPRQGYPVFDGERQVGQVTSGSQGIFVGHPIAFAFVPRGYSELGKKLHVQIRDAKVAAEVIKRPFYKRK